MMVRDRLPEDFFEEMWTTIDWKAAEQRLKSLQRQLTKATIDFDREAQRRLEDEITHDFDCRCLAVRHVGNSDSGPGVDKIRWKTGAQMMRAAMELNPPDYEAKPLREIILKSKSTGKERRVGLPTYFDRAMLKLYSYALTPITEARAERKSFAFRQGRSAQDAQAYVIDCLNAPDAPEIVVSADIEAFYANVQHSWMMKNVPMDKHVLHEFLKAGLVFAGELYPRGDSGMSEGSNLSPHIANYIIDGLLGRIYNGLNGGEKVTDYADGNLIRFADDILVTVRTFDQANVVIDILSEFLAERGLRLSAEKTKICTVDGGFTFLAQEYRRVNGVVRCFPSTETVDRFIRRLVDTVDGNRKSQRDLIEKLNRMLKGWANYHRFSDASEAFLKVDVALQTALLEALIKRYPRMNVKELIDTYFYEEHGRHYYAVPDDVSTRVVKLPETILAHHKKVKTNVNPFLDTDYIEARNHQREVQNVSGVYKGVWKRQNGRCYHCGRKILVDHDKAVVLMDPTKEDTPENSAYVHKMCEASPLEIMETWDSLTSFVPYDTLSVLEYIEAHEHDGRIHLHYPKDWKYLPLKEYFAKRRETRLTLTFMEIESIVGKPLPPSAYKRDSFWRTSGSTVRMADAWLSEEYYLDELKMDEQKASFKRKRAGYVKAVFPREITDQKIPDDAAYEINQFLHYIIKRYDLRLVS